MLTLDRTMFQWPFQSANSLASPYVWVFFAVTVPLTLMVYAVWVVWDKRSYKQYQIKHDESVKAFEIELKQRLRSATGTW